MYFLTSVLHSGAVCNHAPGILGYCDRFFMPGEFKLMLQDWGWGDEASNFYFADVTASVLPKFKNKFLVVCD